MFQDLISARERHHKRPPPPSQPAEQEENSEIEQRAAQLAKEIADLCAEFYKRSYVIEESRKRADDIIDEEALAVQQICDEIIAKKNAGVYGTAL